MMSARSGSQRVVEHDVAHRPPPHRAVVPSRPADDDVAGEHPSVGDPDRLAHQLLAAVGRPTGRAGAEALGSGGEVEVLHGGEDGCALQEVGGELVVERDEQHRGPLAGEVVQLVGGTVAAGVAGHVVGGGSTHAVDGLDDLQRRVGRLLHHGPHLGRVEDDEAPVLRVPAARRPGRRLEAPMERRLVDGLIGEPADGPRGGEHLPDVLCRLAHGPPPRSGACGMYTASSGEAAGAGSRKPEAVR